MVRTGKSSTAAQEAKAAGIMTLNVKMDGTKVLRCNSDLMN
jgi:hypothetical protein